MIRERVDVSGIVRAMEPAEEIEALRMPPQEIGLIKERPVRRWLEGQEAWDKKFKHTVEQVLRKRKHYEEKAERLLRHAREQFPGLDSPILPVVNRRQLSALFSRWPMLCLDGEVT